MITYEVVVLLLGAAMFLALMVRVDLRDSKAPPPVTYWQRAVAVYLAADPLDPTATTAFLLEADRITDLDVPAYRTRLPGDTPVGHSTQLAADWHRAHQGLPARTVMVAERGPETLLPRRTVAEARQPSRARLLRDLARTPAGAERLLAELRLLPDSQHEAAGRLVQAGAITVDEARRALSDAQCACRHCNAWEQTP